MKSLISSLGLALALTTGPALADGHTAKESMAKDKMPGVATEKGKMMPKNSDQRETQTDHNDKVTPKSATPDRMNAASSPKSRMHKDNPRSETLNRPENANSPAADTVEYIEMQQAGTWFAQDLVGLAVKNPGGEKIGDINNLVLDQSGHVKAVVIGVGGFLGIGEKNVAVPFTALTINQTNNNKRLVVINATKKQLETAPKFKQFKESEDKKRKS